MVFSTELVATSAFPLAWGFAGIYLATLAALTVAFTAAFRRKRAEYQEVLDRFHHDR